MPEPTMPEPTPTLPQRPSLHATRRILDRGADGLPTAAAPTSPANQTTARARDILLAVAARLLGFGAVLGALGFACLGWWIR